MFIYRTFLVVLTIFVLLAGCADEIKNCCNQSQANGLQIEAPGSLKIDSTFVENPQMRAVYNTSGIYANFGFQFFIEDSSYYLVYLNSSKDSLVFINVFNPTKFKIKNVSGFIKAKGKYTIKLISDTLHLLDIETYNYKQLKIKKDLALEKIYESNLSGAFNTTALFLNSNLVVDKKLVFFKPYLISFYGNYNSKNNLGSNVWMKINTNTGEKDEFFDFPAEYKQCYQRDFYTVLEKISDSLVLTIFRKLNKIYEVNIYSGKIIKTSSPFLFHSNYMCYNKEQEKNLAYTSKYDLLDEENSNLIFSGEKIFVIKRLVRKDKRDLVKCAILVFDEDLNHIATYYPNKPVQPRLSFGYKDGIAILSDSLNKTYYYGFKGNE